MNLKYFVEQGKYAIEDAANVPFGTSGLTTCVGVIAKLENGKNFCGHMDHKITAENKLAFIQSVTEVLKDAFEGKKVEEIICCNPGGSLEAKYTIDAIKEFFSQHSSKLTVHYNDGKWDGIYIDEKREINGLPSGAVSQKGSLSKDATTGSFRVKEKE